MMQDTILLDTIFGVSSTYPPIVGVISFFRPPRYPPSSKFEMDQIYGLNTNGGTPREEVSIAILTFGKVVVMFIFPPRCVCVVPPPQQRKERWSALFW